MLQHKLVRVESAVSLTEAVLEEMESLSRIPGERDLQKNRLKFIRKLLADGEFNRCEWATCLCKENETLYRVNGQHSSAILRESLKGDDEELSFPAGIPVIVSRYECDTIESLADVFDQFDSPVSARSAEDKLGIYMAQFRDMIGIDKKFCGQVLRGVSWAILHVPTATKALGENVKSPTAYDRGLLLRHDLVREFIDMLHQWPDAPFREWLNRSGIVARTFDLFLEDRETSEVAIEQMVYEVGEAATVFTKEVRTSAMRTGKDEGFYYRKTEKYLKKALAEITAQGKDVIRQMIREVIAESENAEDAA